MAQFVRKQVQKRKRNNGIKMKAMKKSELRKEGKQKMLGNLGKLGKHGG